MQKVFFRNLAFVITVNIIIKPLWIFGIDRTVQNVVGPENYGLYFVLLSLSLMTQIILDLGISNYNNLLIAQREDLLSKHLSNIFSIKLWLLAIYLIITFSLALLLDYRGHILYLLLFICLNQALASLIVYLRTNISALHHFKVDSLFSIMDKSLMIIICGTLLYVSAFRSGFTIQWFIYAQFASYLITLAIALIYVLNISGKIPLVFSWSFSLKLFKETFPFAMLIALMLFYARMDALLIENLLPADGTREAGLYASAFRLLDALNQFSYLFAVLLLPIFSRMLARKQKTEELVKASFTVIFITAVLASLAMSIYSGQIMNLLYHEGNAYSATILSNLIFSFIGYSTIFIFGTLLTANGNLKELIIISAFAVVMNLLINFYLIPSNKAAGAALAATITQLTIALLNFGVAQYIFKWKINYNFLLRLLVFVLLSFTCFYFSKEAAGFWLIKMLIAAAICLMIAFMIGLLKIKRIIQLVREN